MRLRRVETLDLLNQQRQVELPAGIYKGVLLRFWGDAAAGVTVALTDFGVLIHRFRGKATQNWRVADMWLYAHLRGGRPEAVSAVGAAFAFDAILPYCYGPLNTYNIDDNVLNVRQGECFIDIPAVSSAVADSVFVDVCVLEDTGVCRYNPQIFMQGVESTGQNRIKVATPNLRHFLLTQFDGVAQPNAILYTRDNDVRVEGDWNQLLALTDIDSMVELGAAATGAIFPDLGNNNPATWCGGRQEVRITGATAGSNAFFTEFGAEPISAEEYMTVKEVEANKLAAGMTSSPMPFNEATAPITSERVLSVKTPEVTPVVPPNREQDAIARGPQPRVITPRRVLMRPRRAV